VQSSIGTSHAWDSQVNFVAFRSLKRRRHHSAAVPGLADRKNHRSPIAVTPIGSSSHIQYWNVAERSCWLNVEECQEHRGSFRLSKPEAENPMIPCCVSRFPQTSSESILGWPAGRHGSRKSDFATKSQYRPSSPTP
jgi:hypothetical protein